MKHIPFVYKITNKLNNKMYIGVRIAKNCSPTDLGNTYFSSSKPLKKDIDAYGKENFKFEIIKIFDKKEDALEEEYKLLMEVDAMNNPNYYNLSNGKGVCPGLEKGTSTCINIITNQKIRIPINELKKNPLFCSIGKHSVLKVIFNGITYILTNRYNRIEFCSEFNISLNQINKLINNGTYVPKQRRYDRLKNLEVKSIELKDIDSDFIINNNFYNPYEIDILGISSEYYEYKDWLKAIKGKYGATIRSMKGYKQSNTTKEKMRMNSNIKGKKEYHNIFTQEIRYFNSDEVIPKDYIKGKSSKNKENMKAKIKDMLFYHNPITKEQSRFVKDKQPKGWIKGRIRFNNKGFDKINDANTKRIFNIYKFQYEYVNIEMLKTTFNYTKSTYKDTRYKIYFYDNLYFDTPDTLIKYINNKGYMFKVDVIRYIINNTEDKIKHNKITKMDITKWKELHIGKLNKEVIKTIDLRNIEECLRYNIKVLTKENLNEL